MVILKYSTTPYYKNKLAPRFNSFTRHTNKLSYYQNKMFFNFLRDKKNIIIFFTEKREINNVQLSAFPVRITPKNEL